MKDSHKLKPELLQETAVTTSGMLTKQQYFCAGNSPRAERIQDQASRGSKIVGLIRQPSPAKPAIGPTVRQFQRAVGLIKPTNGVNLRMA